MTQEQLAAAVDIHTPAISRIESGKLGVSLSMAHELADALGVRTHELFFSGEIATPSELLDGEERLLVARWRSLGDRERVIVRQVLAWAAGASTGGDLSLARDDGAHLIAEFQRPPVRRPSPAPASDVTARTPTKPR